MRSQGPHLDLLVTAAVLASAHDVQGLRRDREFLRRHAEASGEHARLLHGAAHLALQDERGDLALDEARSHDLLDCGERDDDKLGLACGDGEAQEVQQRGGSYVRDRTGQLL